MPPNNEIDQVFYNNRNNDDDNNDKNNDNINFKERVIFDNNVFDDNKPDTDNVMKLIYMMINQKLKV